MENIDEIEELNEAQLLNDYFNEENINNLNIK